MSTTLNFTTQWTIITCYKCSIQFAVAASVNDNWKNPASGRNPDFYCPNGHAQSYVTSEAQKLRDELTRERARLDQVRADNDRLRSRVAAKDRQVAAQKGVATRLRKRVSAGKCPCCHAKFADLAQHMKTQHPKWDPEKAAVAIAEKAST